MLDLYSRQVPIFGAEEVISVLSNRGVPVDYKDDKNIMYMIVSVPRDYDYILDDTIDLVGAGRKRRVSRVSHAGFG